MVTMLIGLPGCGKSTYASKLKGFTVLSSDAIRKEIYGSEEVQTDPKRVFTILYNRMEQLVSKGENVVLDATHIKKKDRFVALKIAHKYNQPVEAIVFDVPLDVCLERNNSRERKVPESAYERMLRQYERPTLEEGFSNIVSITE